MALDNVQMRLLVLSFFLMMCTYAQGQTSIEQRANEANLRQIQHEIDMARIQAQTESIRTQTEILRLQMEMRQTERAVQPREKSLAERLDEYHERKAAEKSANQAAAQAEADREEESAVAAAKSANTVYLGLGLVLPVALAFLIARRAKPAGGTMNHEEKFGVMLMVASLLLGLLALSISENWVHRLDVVQNLMLTLKIRILPESEEPYSYAMVVVPTKYVLLALVAVAAYGFTTYLGITPAWQKREATLVLASESIEPPKEI